ncbi:hypothetical protein Tco_1407081 [Tanacetum coccineum]
MKSLSKRYERLKTIPEELRIRSNHPVPGQVLSITLGRKRKHMELKPEIGIPRLKCNRSLPEGVPFVNNMVIEEPEYIMFFINEYDHIPPKEKCTTLLLAEDRFLKIKQAVDEEHNQPEVIQDLLLKLMNDLQILNGIQPKQEEPVAQSFLLNWNFPMADDDEYTIIYRSTKAITPDSPTEEPDNSLSMGDEHLNTLPETEKSSVENHVPIPSESKGISEDICDHFDAEFGLINSLLSRDISITSPKIDFLPEEFAGELNLIDPILPGINEDDFDEEEGEIDIDILQIEDKILREKLLNVILLIDKIKALNHTPSIPLELEYRSSSPIPVVDSEFLIEEVDTYLVPKDSIPPGIESDFDSEGDIIFLDNLLNDDLIPEYERFTFDIEPDAPVINNFDELNEDECFDPGGGGFASFLSRVSCFVMFVQDCPDFEGSRARCFIHRSLALQILIMLILGIRYP